MSNYETKAGASRMMALWRRAGGKAEAVGGTIIFKGSDGASIAGWKMDAPRRKRLGAPDGCGGLEYGEGVLLDLSRILASHSPSAQASEVSELDAVRSDRDRLRSDFRLLEDALLAARSVIDATVALAEAKQALVGAEARLDAAIRRQKATEEALAASKR